MTKAFWCGIIIISKGFAYYEEVVKWNLKFIVLWIIDPTAKKMLEAYPALANYNFRTDKTGNSYVNITSLEQMMQLVKEIGQNIILSPYDNSIEIYDNYRE